VKEGLGVYFLQLGMRDHFRLRRANKDQAGPKGAKGIRGGGRIAGERVFDGEKKRGRVENEEKRWKM